VFEIQFLEQNTFALIQGCPGTIVKCINIPKIVHDGLLNLCTNNSAAGADAQKNFTAEPKHVCGSFGILLTTEHFR